MKSYKILKSIAYNLGHSFTSLMNYSGNDYVLGHILIAARKTGKNLLEVDFINKSASPAELLVDPVKQSVDQYINSFSDWVNRSGSDITLITSAKLTLEYNLDQTRQFPHDSNIIENPYSCDVIITDNRNKTHNAHFSGWWYPE